MSQLGVELLPFCQDIETIQPNGVLENVNYLMPVIPKHSTLVCIHKEEIVLLPDEDQRKWTLTFGNITPATDGSNTTNASIKCYQLVYTKHNALTMDNGGALLYIPFSHGIQEEPSMQKLLQRKFRSKKDHKIYDMKKAHLLLQPEQMLLFDKFCWRSLDRNKTSEPISLVVVTLQKVVVKK